MDPIHTQNIWYLCGCWVSSPPIFFLFVFPYTGCSCMRLCSPEHTHTHRRQQTRKTHGLQESQQPHKRNLPFSSRATASGLIIWSRKKKKQSCMSSIKYSSFSLWLQQSSMSGHMIRSEIYLDLYSIRKSAAIFWQRAENCNNRVALGSGTLPI